MGNIFTHDNFFFFFEDNCKKTESRSFNPLKIKKHVSKISQTFQDILRASQRMFLKKISFFVLFSILGSNLSYVIGLVVNSYGGLLNIQ